MSKKRIESQKWIGLLLGGIMSLAVLATASISRGDSRGEVRAAKARSAAVTTAAGPPIKLRYAEAEKDTLDLQLD
jgi:hypothetical protein